VSSYTQLKAPVTAQRAIGMAEVGEARRLLEMAGMTCDDACPPLLAMQAGVAHLCRIKESHDDVVLCRDVRAELAANEARLKPSCGTCGPHVESNDAGPDSYEGPL
jgi:hypothetical protein